MFLVWSKNNLKKRTLALLNLSFYFQHCKVGVSLDQLHQRMINALGSELQRESFGDNKGKFSNTVESVPLAHTSIQSD